MNSRALATKSQIDIDAYDFYGPLNQRGTPERNMLMALLERAILDYVGNEKKEIEQAGEWIFNDDDDNEEPLEEFSFNWVCQQLDLEPNKVAETIRLMPKRGNRRVAPWYFAKA